MWLQRSLATLSTLFAAGLMIAGAQAAVISESEPNDTLASAQNIDAFFTLDFSANIGDVTGANTSTTIPHVTIDATGNGTYDYYSFTVPFAGAVGIFDIDFGMDAPSGSPQPPGSIDTELALWNALGVPLAENDDFSTTAGAGGSIHAFDAFIQFIFPAPGLYIVGVAEFQATALAGGWTGGIPDTGDTYTLQVSIQQAPEPGSLALMSLALAGFALVSRRRRLR